VSWLTARYLIESEPDLIEQRANALALEQSVECPLEAIGSGFVLDEIVARVAEIREIGAQAEKIGEDGARRYLVDVRIATVTTGGEPAQLMNMIFGNCSLWDNVRFVDVEFPPNLLEKFPGPRHGIAGIRKLIGARERPLTATATKPQGLPISELAGLCRTFVLAGVDIVKDDHGIADQPYSPYVERVRACQTAALQASKETGKPAFYAPNLTGSPRALRERARLARELGIRVVLAAPMLLGLPAFYDLVDEFPEFVYLAHPSFGGAARIEPSLLFGKIFRLFGADAVIFVNYGGRFAYSREESLSIAAALRAPWDHVAPAMPVPAGGMLVERADELLDDYGPDSMLLIGGNLLVARENLLERTREFVSRVERHRFADSALRSR
jgi:ribulose-bisphosphate carboxylase large chain